MRTESQTAADKVSAKVRALANKLAMNDFPHMEARLESVEVRLGERLDRMEARTEKMKVRQLYAIRGRHEDPMRHETSPDTPEAADGPWAGRIRPAAEGAVSGFC